MVIEEGGGLFVGWDLPERFARLPFCLVLQKRKGRRERQGQVTSICPFV